MMEPEQVVSCLGSILCKTQECGSIANYAMIFSLVQLSQFSHSPSFWLSCCFLPVPTSYLAHDIEEDEVGDKFRILPWALGGGGKWRFQLPIIMHQRDQLWARMNFRAIVSRIICEEVREKDRDQQRCQSETSREIASEAYLLLMFLVRLFDLFGSQFEYLIDTVGSLY